MRYRLRTLMILLAVGPPLMASAQEPPLYDDILRLEELLERASRQLSLPAKWRLEKRLESASAEKSGAPVPSLMFPEGIERAMQIDASPKSRIRG